MDENEPWEVMTRDNYTARLRFDERAGGGWYAEYSKGGNVLDDSEKVNHPDMPRHPGAFVIARRIMEKHLEALAAQE